MKTVQDIIADIKNVIGVDLKPCDYFTGIRTNQLSRFFNIVTDRPVWDCKEYDLLLRASKKHDFIKRVEPNGTNRIAIFF